VKSLKAEKEKLEIWEKRIIKYIDNFLSETRLWDKITRSRRWGRQGFSRESRTAYIKGRFRLAPLFNHIDSDIKHLELFIRCFEGLRMTLGDRRSIIQGQTLVILAWLKGMKRSGLAKHEKFKDIMLLLKWFYENEKDEIQSLFGINLVANERVVRRDYERYLEVTNTSYAQLIDEYFDSMFSDSEETPKVTVMRPRSQRHWELL